MDTDVGLSERKRMLALKGQSLKSMRAQREPYAIAYSTLSPTHQAQLTRKSLELDRHRLACTVYSVSLIALYTASTLYHSFFMLQRKRRDIFL